LKKKRNRVFDFCELVTGDRLMGSFFKNCGVRAALSVFAGLLITASANAEEEVGCVGDATFTVLVDGNTSCGNVEGMYGCRINDGIGECEFVSPLGGMGFRAVATQDPVTKKISFGTFPIDGLEELYVDFTGAGGAEQGGACGRMYKPEVVSGDGLAFVKSNTGVQKTTYLDVCTDLSNQAPAPVVQSPNVCDGDIKNALTSFDGAEDGLPDFAIVGYIGEPNKTAFCVGNDASIEGCVNLQSDVDSPRLPGVRYCDEGPDQKPLDPDTGLSVGDGIPDGPQPLRRNMTFDVSKTGDNSQIFVCVPPPMTLDGTESCGWVYY
jgi:hypothetical protein